MLIACLRRRSIQMERDLLAHAFQLTLMNEPENTGEKCVNGSDGSFAEAIV